MAKYVMGTYNNIADAKSAITQLEKEGYPNTSLSLLAHESKLSGLSGLGLPLEDSSYADSDYNTLWHRIKRFFGRDVESETAVFGHQQDLRSGKILLLADCSKVNDTMLAGAQKKDSAYWADAHKQAITNPDESTIRLMQEHLKVSKESVTAGEVIIKKRVVEDTETIDVPIRHEELTIERRPVSGVVAASDKFEEETYTFPLTEERVQVTKIPVVTEEIRVSKRNVTGEKHVSDTVRREELNVDKAGNVIVEGLKEGPGLRP